jgi:uncharacterized membrane protein YhaH (DUF805 family)
MANTHSIHNPYAPPTAVVADIMLGAGTDFQPIKIFSTKGRIGRLRYFTYLLSANLIIGLAMGTVVLIAGFIFAGLGGGDFPEVKTTNLVGTMKWIMMPFQLTFLILFSIQRSHDMNWSGWTTLILITLVVGRAIATALGTPATMPALLILYLIVSLVWLFVPGTKGTNRFGPPPPPNSSGVKIFGGIFIGLFVLWIIGIIVVIAIPAYQGYAHAHATQSQQQ